MYSILLENKKTGTIQLLSLRATFNGEAIRLRPRNYKIDEFSIQQLHNYRKRIVIVRIYFDRL